jgi:hypothetical protein
MFVRNAWYAAGFSDEFGRHLLARTYLGEAVVKLSAPEWQSVKAKTGKYAELLSKA